MSALTDEARRRADKLASEQYEALRAGVLRTVRGKLGTTFVSEPDLDAAYNEAWRSLLELLYEDRRVENSGGWLATTTYRRAIEGVRVARPGQHVELDELADSFAEYGGEDFATSIDNVDQVRALGQVMRHRLDGDDGEIARMLVLEVSRPEISDRLGIPIKRLHKIIDGHKGRAGVMKQIGVWVEEIAAGRWCDHNRSLITAYSKRLLRPGSRKLVEAEEHLSTCPGCRHYSRAASGIYSLLPPVGPVAAGAWVLGHLQEAARSVGDGVRSFFGHGGGDGAAAGGAAAASGTAGAAGVAGGSGAGATTGATAGGAAVGGGAFALGGLSAGRVVAGCVAAVGAAACVAGGVVVAANDPPRNEPASQTVVASAPPESAAADPRASLTLTPAVAPLVPESEETGAATAGQDPEVDAARRREETSGQPEAMVGQDLRPSIVGHDFNFENSGGSAARRSTQRSSQSSRTPRSSRRSAKDAAHGGVTRDLDIENTAGSAPASNSAPAPAPTPAPEPAPAPAPAPEPAPAPTPEPAPAPTPEPQRETFGIER